MGIRHKISQSAGKEALLPIRQCSSPDAQKSKLQQGRIGSLLNLQRTQGNRYVLQYLNRKENLPEKEKRTSPIVPSIVTDVLSSPGQKLAPSLRTSMESLFGTDFSQVRVHTDSRAAQSALTVGALAYTVNQDIVFGANQYAPATSVGQRLLAHELTHVVQQKHSPHNLQVLRLDNPSSSPFEQEATTVSEAIANGRPVRVRQSLPAATIQRQLGIVNEPAGGCGVCYGQANFAGIAAHKAIQLEFEILHSFGLVEFPLVSPGDENGRLDLAIATPTGFKIGEIKPANPKGMERGIKDIAFYTAALKSKFPNRTVELLTEPIPPVVFPDPLKSPNCPGQELFTSNLIPGVYGYFCFPPFSELRQKCKCDRESKKRKQQDVNKTVPRDVRETTKQPEKGQQEKPEANKQPGLIPSSAKRSAIEQIIKFIKRVIQSGEDADAAARQFLNQHPDVKYLLIGAAVAIIITTLAEDIASFGAGLLDDPASIGVAFTLIKVAQAGG